MRCGGDRNLDLGPDAVCARGQVTSARQRVQAGERANTDGHLFAVRGRDQWLDPLQRALVSLDVDARRGIRQTLARHFLDFREQRRGGPRDVV